MLVFTSCGTLNVVKPILSRCVIKWFAVDAELRCYGDSASVEDVFDGIRQVPALISGRVDEGSQSPLQIMITGDHS